MIRLLAFALVLSAILALILAPAIALADISGKPRVIDGDTVEIAGERVRLHAINAPEFEQTCVADGKRWRCGMEASLALAFKIARGWGDIARARARATTRACRHFGKACVRGQL